ncbi:MAG: sulfate reduction electron transfer complex DsrMKJOP subunit DsrM [Gammaproteobacteria bacterium]|nr:sulfate reduction electron transfer complex DsrMKJOP subunit DsrM [Gammaproteobacteria bacterium]
MLALYATGLVLLLAALGALAAGWTATTVLVAVVLPYVAWLTLVAGLCYRVWLWARTPVPFRIPTTSGQQRSLPWLRRAPIDNPDSGAAAAVRVVIEMLLFRSLLFNNRPRLASGRLSFIPTLGLWLGGLTMHWALLIIVLRHLRFALEPTPAWVNTLNALDGILLLGGPPLLITDVVVLLALLYLLARRGLDPVMRYLSLFTDYFALLLLLGIAVSGVALRYVARVDIVAVKQLILGIVRFHPQLPAAPSPLLLVHLLLVCTLAMYLPFSKLMHAGGVLFSPTRNLANNSRRRRHVNPWNPQLPMHTYAEWEAEYADKLKLAGLPLENAPHGRPEDKH